MGAGGRRSIKNRDLAPVPNVNLVRFCASFDLQPALRVAASAGDRFDERVVDVERGEDEVFIEVRGFELIRIAAGGRVASSLGERLETYRRGAHTLKLPRFMYALNS